MHAAGRPLPNLTVKPGVRIDTVAMDNHVGDPVADMDRLQPRFGMAWAEGVVAQEVDEMGHKIFDEVALSGA